MGPLTWWMAEQLPDVQTRNTAIGIAYNVASMVRTHSSQHPLFTALTLQHSLFTALTLQHPLFTALTLQLFFSTHCNVV